MRVYCALACVTAVCVCAQNVHDVTIRDVAVQLVNVQGVTVKDVAVQNATVYDVTIYDAYFGKPLTRRRAVSLSNVVNGTLLCTVPVRACEKTEGRRVDGTCTNPHHPSRGATLTPMPRLLPALYGQGNTLRPANDGSPLPSTRHIRTTLWGDGHFRENTFSSLVSIVFAFSVVDTVDLLYVGSYSTVSDCCIDNQVPNLADPRCIPIPVQQDDPFLRRTDIRCMNLTRVETYQGYGCISNNIPAERYSRVPPLLDLSTVYGNTEDRSRQIRSNSGGLLAFRMEGEREVPAGQSPFCLANKPENMETACYDYGDNYNGNTVPGAYMTAMWFFREHNRLARLLAALNPCWDDQRLFNTARQINIAQWQYIFYYELVPKLIGYKSALASGVIYKTKGYVNDFNPKREPGVYREYTLGTRSLHGIRPGFTDLYRNGTYVGSRTAVDDVFRSGILAVNDTEADVTFSAIYQPSDRFDYILDPDFGNRVLGEFQAASDIGAVDMMRGRDAGLPPYNEYRKLCGMKPAKTFDDLSDVFDKDKVELLRRLYLDVDDVELMVAVYNERLVPEGYVGPTLHCIMTHNYLLWRHSDMFFFEHGGFPAALTKRQLNEVRNTRMARILCDNGVGIKQIQPHAFLRLSKMNDFVPCQKIPGMDLSAWKDPTCQ